MTWLTAALVASAVFIAFRPDSSHRLESIMSHSRSAGPSGSLAAALARITG